MVNFLKSRVFQYGSTAGIAVLAVLGILVVINLLATRYHYRMDTTEDRMFSLSDKTVTLLDSLDQDVQVTAFFPNAERPYIEKILRQYAFQSSHFSFRFVDPDQSPAEARRSKVTDAGVAVVEADGRQERVYGIEESDLTNAIIKVVRTRQKTVYFLTGHGERAPEDFFRFGYNKAKLAMQDVNYAIRDTLLLARVHQVPDDCDLLIVAGPKTGLFPAELDSIESYLAAGGAGLFLLDPEVETGLAPMLAKWEIGVSNDYVVDRSGVGKLFGLDHTMPVAAEYATHPVTGKHKGLMTFFRHARSITRLADSAEMQVVELVKTSPASWREMTLGNEKPEFDAGKDVRGPVSLAVAVKAKPGRPRVWGNDAGVRFTQIVVFGDSDFASNQFFDVQGNGDLFLNAVSWLLEEGDLIAIRPRERSIRRVDLTLRDVQWVRWLSLVILPVTPIFIWVVIWWRRR